MEGTCGLVYIYFTRLEGNILLYNESWTLELIQVHWHRIVPSPKVVEGNDGSGSNDEI